MIATRLGKIPFLRVSSTQVSQAAAELDEHLEAWHQRPRGRRRCLWPDAYQEEVRQDGQVRDAAILKAIDLNDEGKRMILGVSVALSEHEVHWRAFLQSLGKRGLTGVQLITSEDQQDLKKARRAIFGAVRLTRGSERRQRCQFHFLLNLLARIP